MSTKRIDDAGEKLLAAAGGWIIRAIEEYGVGGDHKPDTAQFLLIGSQLATQIGQALVSNESAPEGTAADAIDHVLKKHIARAVS